MIEIYQINLTEEEVSLLNDAGWDGAADQNKNIMAYLNIYSSILNEGSYVGKLSGNIDTYKYAGKVDTDNLNTVWEIGNNARLPMGIHPVFHSISVGDILHNSKEGTWHVVLSFGFSEITDQGLLNELRSLPAQFNNDIQDIEPITEYLPCELGGFS